MQKVQDDPVLSALLRPVIHAVKYVPLHLFLSCIHPRMNLPFHSTGVKNLYDDIVDLFKGKLDYLLDSVTGFLKEEAQADFDALAANVLNFVQQGLPSFLIILL